ncbi:unnamed protein product [Phyllotreta striolata]|uniref:G-protein coupled receptors family 1 profile domain-containing protein n=1 Tax=Phyllotreta striolata TaxID=444603 RepID=A0A9N9XLR4_PHYSR|nr:unnamed protein product [Phyllotreta striolata]
MEKEINSTDPLDHMPEEVWRALAPLVAGVNASEVDLCKPRLKEVFFNYYGLVYFFYGILVCYGFLCNSFIFYIIIKKKLYNDPLYSFLLNNAISDIVKCCVVVPLSLYVLMIRNWVLGELLCTFLPMIQDIPQHVSTLTFVIMAWDRFRFIKKPYRQRLPAFVCNFALWLTSMCLVLPYSKYIMYIDLGQVYQKLPAVQCVGFCTVNLLYDISEYVRGIFVTMFIAPFTIIFCFYYRISTELAKQNPVPAIKYEASTRSTKAKADTLTAGLSESSRSDHDRSSQYSHRSLQGSDRGRTYYEFREPRLNVIKERRTQKFLTAIVVIYGICLTPLMVMKVVRISITETKENLRYLDVLYILLVWFAFLPTCVTPALLLVWRLGRKPLERERFIPLNERNTRLSGDTVTTLTGTPASNRFTRSRYSEETFIDTNGSQQDLPST